MSAWLNLELRAAVRAGLSGFFVLACCGAGAPGPGPAGPGPIELPPATPPPCGLTSSTQFVEDPKFAKNLGKFTPPPEPTADELDGHCRAVWQHVVEEQRCGNVAIPAFCATCSAETKPKCLEGNGRGHVMQRCLEASLPAFTAKYATCQDFVLCAGKIQAKTAECQAGRQ